MLKLLTLAPSILAELSDPQRTGPLPTEHRLREIMMIGAHPTQVRMYRSTIGTLLRKEKQAPVSLGPKGVRRNGFQHLFTKARKLEELCKTGQFVSQVELGLAVGMCASRVGQLLSLLELAPDLIEKLDRPVEPGKPWLSSVQLRRLSIVRNYHDQRNLYQAMISEIDAPA